MEWTDDRKEIGRAFISAILSGEIDTMTELRSNNPWLLIDHLWTGLPWLKEAARVGNLQALAQLLDWGYHVDPLDQNGNTPLRTAVLHEHFEVAQCLLERGADPNVGRIVLTALNLSDKASRQRFLELLIGGGVDLNQPFKFFGDQNRMFTALDHVSVKDEQTISFLRSNGAKYFAEQ